MVKLCTHTHIRFVPMMPTPALFIAFSFLIQIVEGVGTAMYATASYTQLTQFYPDKKGKIVVSGPVNIRSALTFTVLQSPWLV